MSASRAGGRCVSIAEFQINCIHIRTNPFWFAEVFHVDPRSQVLQAPRIAASESGARKGHKPTSIGVSPNNQISLDG